MARKRKPPTETIAPTPAAEPESLPLPFDDSEEVTRENELLGAMHPAQRAFVEAEPPFTMTPAKLRIESEWTSTQPVEVVPPPLTGYLDAVLAIIDEYVLKCGDGSTLRLEKVIELRDRVAKL